jgi:hypothetical protein
MTEALVRAAMPTKVTLRRCAFQSLPFASQRLPIHHSHNERHHSHSLSHPRLAAITAQPHRLAAHLASTLCSTLAQTNSNTTNTFATSRRPLSQYREQQYPRTTASHRPRFHPRGEGSIRQGCHRRAQGIAALLRHDLHMQEVPGSLVASHHQAGLPLWHCLDKLPRV